MVVRPKDSALPFLGVAVENFKPSSGIALAAEFGGKFTSASDLSYCAMIAREASRGTAEAVEKPRLALA
jgi:hypothetical protein